MLYELYNSLNRVWTFDSICKFHLLLASIDSRLLFMSKWFCNEKKDFYVTKTILGYKTEISVKGSQKNYLFDWLVKNKIIINMISYLKFVILINQILDGVVHPFIHNLLTIEPKSLPRLCHSWHAICSKCPFLSINDYFILSLDWFWGFMVDVREASVLYFFFYLEITFK